MNNTQNKFPAQNWTPLVSLFDLSKGSVAGAHIIALRLLLPTNCSEIIK